MIMGPDPITSIVLRSVRAGMLGNTHNVRTIDYMYLYTLSAEDWQVATIHWYAIWQVILVNMFLFWL